MLKIIVHQICKHVDMVIKSMCEPTHNLNQMIWFSFEQDRIQKPWFSCLLQGQVYMLIMETWVSKLITTLGTSIFSPLPTYFALPNCPYNLLTILLELTSTPCSIWWCGLQMMTTTNISSLLWWYVVGLVVVVVILHLCISFTIWWWMCWLYE